MAAAIVITIKATQSANVDNPVLTVVIEVYPVESVIAL